jgi:hypothetical protein
MRKNLGFLLILVLSTLCFSGCLYLRPLGPCYGVGCPALTSQQTPQNAGAQPATPSSQAAQNQPSQSQSAANQPGWAQTSQSASAPAAENQAPQTQAQPAQTSKPKKSFLAHLKFW